MEAVRWLVLLAAPLEKLLLCLQDATSQLRLPKKLRNAAAIKRPLADALLLQSQQCQLLDAALELLCKILDAALQLIYKTLDAVTRRKSMIHAVASRKNALRPQCRAKDVPPRTPVVTLAALLKKSTRKSLDAAKLDLRLRVATNLVLR